MMTHSISLHNVTFSHTQTATIFNKLNISFVPGTCAIVGQNGAGKTTLLKLLRGLLTPQAGCVCLNGQDIAGVSVADCAGNIGFVFQNPDDQIFESTVLREVMFGLLQTGMDEKDAKTAAQESLELVGLLNKSQVNPYDLSPSERKMVAIASIVAMDTQVVLLDEPTMAQDDASKERLEAIIDHLVSQQKIVIAVLHDMDFVARAFDRVIVLVHGSVAFDGAARELFLHNDLLKQAKLDKPDVVKLGEAMGFDAPTRSVDEFVRAYRHATR